MESFNSQEKMKREIKDSVFTNLFKDKKYTAKLIEALHPELSEVDENDITAVTLDNVLVDSIHNDLAVMYLNKIMIFVEEQSYYNPNISIRLMIYGIRTIQNYITENDLNVYSSKKLQLPKFEFYCVCAYDKKESYPDYEQFGDKEDFLHGKVKMLYPNIKERTIISEYVQFAKGVTTIQIMRLSQSEKIERLKEFIEKCIKDNILRDYLGQHKKEVISMVDILFDQKFVNERMLNEARSLARAEGKVEGKVEGKAEGKAECISKIMKFYGITFEEACNNLGIDKEEMLKVKEIMNQ